MNVADPHDTTRPSWQLYNRLLLLGVSVDDATELMNGYAHELAEQIRQQPEDLETFEGMRQAADLIDPLVSAGLVRPDEEPTP